MFNTISKKTCRFILAIACFSSINTWAQKPSDYSKAAINYFEAGDYYSALEYYQKFLQAKKPEGGFKPYSIQSTSKEDTRGKTTREEATYRIAESYRMLNDPTNAEVWYKECLALNAEQYPLVRYWYALSLRANEKYEEAALQLQLFKEAYTKQDDYSKKAEMELANCWFIQEQLKKTSSGIEVSKAGNNINFKNSNYALSVMDEHYLVFTSTRTEDADMNDGNKDPYTNDLYQVSISEPEKPAEKLNLAAIAGIHQGVGSFAPGNKALFFTRWSMVDGKKIASIYRSEMQSGKWSEPVNLGGEINLEGYSSQQPFITSDGKYLLFASDRPGTTGGFDLWQSALDDQLNPGTVVSLGNTINTAYDEQAPYFHAQSQVLVFSSNGRTGMGGFDLYESKGNFQSWSQPVNPGLPVNSIKDDIYYFATGKRSVWESGYFSSDRSSSCCLDVFSLKKIHVNKMITGKVVDCKTREPLAGVDLHVTGEMDIKLTSNTEGGYGFTLSEYSLMQVNAAKEGYTKESFSINYPEDREAGKLELATVCLSAIIVVDPVPELPMIVYFDFNKSLIRKDAVIIFDSILTVMNADPSLVLEIKGFTDGKGSDDYNQELSKSRVNSCRDYLMKKGMDGSRLILEYNGECCPVEKEEMENGEDNAVGREKNRRVELKFMRK